MVEAPEGIKVPDILPWQSLRKCSFAAPAFHDESIVLPATNNQGLVVFNDDNATPAAPAAADPFSGLALDEWITYTPTRKYEVDRIIAARRSGSGWKVTVKWKG